MSWYESLALAPDCAGTVYREQAFTVMTEENRITGMRFLIPSTVETALDENRWTLDLHKDVPSNLQLSYHMHETCVGADTFPETPRDYLCFEIAYGREMEPVETRVTVVDARVQALNFEEGDWLLENSCNPVAEKLKLFREFSYRIMLREHGMSKDVADISTKDLTKTFSMETNRGIDRHLRHHGLTRMARPIVQKEDSIREHQPVCVQKTPDYTCRGTAYARCVEQHINMLQILSHRKTGEAFMDDAQCVQFVKLTNFHDAVQHMRDIERKKIGLAPRWS